MLFPIRAALIQDLEHTTQRLTGVPTGNGIRYHLDKLDDMTTLENQLNAALHHQLSSYSPELQPAERLWRIADEPIINRCFDTLDDLEDVLEERCRTLLTMQSEIKALTNYHWWPA